MVTSRPALQTHSGFTVVELLVASALTVTLIGAVLALLSQADSTFRVQPEVADMQQRIRVSADALTMDLFLAGAGIDVGPAAGPLIKTFPPILPYRTGDLADDPAAGIYFRSDAISITGVPSSPSQSTIAESLTVDSRQLTVNAQSNCPPSTAQQVCGFEKGSRILLLDSGRGYDVTTAGDVQTPIIGLEHNGRLGMTYSAGTRVVRVETPTYYLKTNGATGISQLMRYDGHRSDLPLVDNVVSLTFRYFGDPQPPLLLEDASGKERADRSTTYGPSPPLIAVDNENDAWPAGENCVFGVQDGRHVPRLPALAAGTGLVELLSDRLVDGPWCPDESHVRRFDADLLRIRRISVTLRVQAASASLRGPAGPLFTRGGTASSARWLVPDQEIHFDVAPRNMNLGW